MNFHRLYELKELGGDNPDSYFNNLEELLKNQTNCYTSLAKDINRLDKDSWEFLRKECSNDLCNPDEKRGWSQLFNKLNEVKGYIHLLEKGCNNIKFIPKSTKNNEETPDLEGTSDKVSFLCEVKTINKSDVEIQRVENRECKEVGLHLNEGLRSQLKLVILKAKSQLENYCSDENMERIAYILINNDDWQREAKQELLPQINSFVLGLNVKGITVEVNFT